MLRCFRSKVSFIMEISELQKLESYRIFLLFFLCLRYRLNNNILQKINEKKFYGYFIQPCSQFVKLKSCKLNVFLFWVIQILVTKSLIVVVIKKQNLCTNAIKSHKHTVNTSGKIQWKHNISNLYNSASANIHFSVWWPWAHCGAYAAVPSLIYF